MVAGKSLDKIMELKQLAGDCDLYNVMRRQKRRQKVVDSKAANAYKSDEARAKSSGYVFDIINRKLNPCRTGNMHTTYTVNAKSLPSATAARFTRYES